MGSAENLILTKPLQACKTTASFHPVADWVFCSQPRTLFSAPAQKDCQFPLCFSTFVSSLSLFHLKFFYSLLLRCFFGCACLELPGLDYYFKGGRFPCQATMEALQKQRMDCCSHGNTTKQVTPNTTPGQCWNILFRFSTHLQLLTHGFRDYYIA